MAVKVYALGMAVDSTTGLSATRQPLLFICDTTAELPITGLIQGDIALAKDTNSQYLATGSTTFEQVATVGGLHPNLAAHDELGLATQAEIDAHAGATDPHTGYLTETAHGGVSPTGHHSNANDHANTLDHARQHSTTSASDHTFPGGTSTFLRADGAWVIEQMIARCWY
jgi:hypothetical protein